MLLWHNKEWLKKWKSLTNINMKKSLVILGITVGSMFNYSCTTDEADEATTGDCGTENYTYNDNVAAVITAKCASCHSPGGQSPALSTYAEVEASLQRVKARAVIDKTMPPSSPLSDEEIKKISCWIDNGNPEN